MKQFMVTFYETGQKWLVPANSQLEITETLKGKGLGGFKIESHVLGCACNGTGIDPDFGDECKCVTATQPVAAEGITPKQAAFIAALLVEIKAIMRLDLAWAVATSKQDAMEIIDLLIVIKSMVQLVKTKLPLLTSEQIEAIRDKANNKPTKQWVQKATKKLVTL